MKPQYLLAVLVYVIILSMPFVLIGQVAFTYDTNGNRINRQLVIGQKNDSLNLSIEGEQLKLFMNDDFEEELGSITYSLWPNPTGGAFVVSISGEPSGSVPVVIALYTLQGEVLFVENLVARKSEFDIGEYPNGVYVMRLSHKGKEVSWKIIKR